jgi:nicotinamidase-related amidase
MERITRDNSAVCLIDHQVGLLSEVRDIPINELKHNVVGLAKGRQASKSAQNVSFTMNIHQKEPNSHEYEELYGDPILRERRSTRFDRSPVGNHAAMAILRRSSR